MADHWNKVSLLGTLTILICFTAVNGTSSETCSDFQSFSWTSILRKSELNVQFLLLTRRNVDCAQVINDENDIENSNFNGSLPTKLIIHGFRLTGKKPSWIDSMAKELINAMDVNVVLVDWNIGAVASYFNAVKILDKLGEKISILLQLFVLQGSTKESFHLIGISLGAHVAGVVGRMFDGKFGRITGLDPAGPKFSNTGVDKRLDPDDAMFVEAIHSDSDNFGISQPVGHIDFYLNDGKKQPGCTQTLLYSVYKRVICDHMRAVYLYISSIKNRCPLVAFPCQTYEQFTNGKCVNCFFHSLQQCPRIGLLENGSLQALLQPREVKAFLMTSSHVPFCVNHFLVELFLGDVGTYNQHVEVIFLNNNYANTSKLKLSIPNKSSKNRTVKTVMSYDPSRGNIMAIFIKLLSTWYRKTHAIYIEKLRMTEIPLNSSERSFRCIYNMTLYKNLFQQFVNCQ
ncbi:phospholipase A1 member A-like [Narcine bancroftii]|uniref:phospholipase A1 member A-like n=1 Tax=Narcine bancroftii TaxID=1343680 RepID=UPI0038319063